MAQYCAPPSTLSEAERGERRSEWRANDRQRRKAMAEDGWERRRANQRRSWRARRDAETDEQRVERLATRRTKSRRTKCRGARDRKNRLVMGLPERFWSKVQVEDRGYPTECLVWTAYKLPNGYGRFLASGRSPAYAHRLAYEAAKGQIADGLCIDHLCRVRACVNADHLEAVTPRENVLRGVHSRCAEAHPAGGGAR